jgi:hypothetical protein
VSSCESLTVRHLLGPKSGWLPAAANPHAGHNSTYRSHCTGQSESPVFRLEMTAR